MSTSRTIICLLRNDLRLHDNEITSEELNVEKNVKLVCTQMKVKVESCWGSTLYHRDDLPFNHISRLPDVYTQFRKVIESQSRVRPVFPTPETLKPIPPGLEEGAIPTAEDLKLTEPVDDSRSAFPCRGGESEALARIKHYFWDTNAVATYKETRNGLIGVDYSTKLAPWLAIGCISPRYIYSQIKSYETQRTANQNTYWVIFELLWRDYFKFVALKYGNQIFHINGLQNKSSPWKKDMKLFNAWKEGRTGVPFVDANMRELAMTGFMSNRGRQNVASFLTKDLGLDWRMGAEWFEYLLVDYDVCSNYGNWLYSAGVGNDPRENRKFNMIKQGLDYDNNGDFVRQWVPELQALRGPDVHTPWTLSAAALSHAQVSLGETYPVPIVIAPEWSRHVGKNSLEGLQGLHIEGKRVCLTPPNSTGTEASIFIFLKAKVASDWRTVAEEMGFSYLEITNYETFKNPTDLILNNWPAQDSEASVGKLLFILTKVERRDVVEELRALIDADVTKYLEKKKEYPPVQVDVVDSCVPRTPERVGITLEDDPDGSPELFDAFICYCQSDFNFVHEMIRELEQTEFKLKLCVFDRDVLPGSCVWTITSELIERR
ncbi:hypothetical protein WMY93_030228 [Mugilogobius chulae]|uniref:Cryptochrome DASH n=1 Tax=Mugilogobius chulae TaxID=88201 RepID=A0AAW0MVF7_9GOBI